MCMNFFFISVTIDTTPPEAGWVKDGEEADKDIRYTSDAATVAMNSGGFADPESGQKEAEWNIMSKHAGWYIQPRMKFVG